MQILKISKKDSKKKNTLRITEYEDGGKMYSLSLNVDGYVENHSLLVPSDVEIIQQK
tara:strand:+ start:67663 stop:67833 length:171 start_codon:yes stop_codon:yes gene_type:complete